MLSENQRIWVDCVSSGHIFALSFPSVDLAAIKMYSRQDTMRKVELQA
jgi:hypothetical protein